MRLIVFAALRLRKRICLEASFGMADGQLRKQSGSFSEDPALTPIVVTEINRQSIVRLASQSLRGLRKLRSSVHAQSDLQGGRVDESLGPWRSLGCSVRDG